MCRRTQPERARTLEIPPSTPCSSRTLLFRCMGLHKPYTPTRQRKFPAMSRTRHRDGPVHAKFFHGCRPRKRPLNRSFRWQRPRLSLAPCDIASECGPLRVNSFHKLPYGIQLHPARVVRVPAVLWLFTKEELDASFLTEPTKHGRRSHHVNRRHRRTIQYRPMPILVTAQPQSLFASLFSATPDRCDLCFMAVAPDLWHPAQSAGCHKSSIAATSPVTRSTRNDISYQVDITLAENVSLADGLHSSE